MASGNSGRREFIRRLVAASALVVTGLASFLGLMESNPGAGAQLQTIGPAAQQVAATSQQASTASQQASTASQQASTASQQASTTSSRSTSTTKPIPSGYILVAPLTALTGRTSAYFNHPKFGTSILLLLNGTWKAFSAVCTHAGCTVQYTGSSIYCPCHAGYFSPSNGSVQGGPPPSPLPEYGVLVQNGSIYVTNQVVN